MYKYISLLSLVLIVFISCSDSNKIVDPPPTQLAYQFSDYIYFDTTNIYIVATSYDGNSYFPEIYVYWEEVIGEPFTDLNGNGVYDPGIDIFIRSVGSDNMDLNHNGLHDGSNDYWSQGVPFDDINGDGIYQHGTNYLYSNNYSQGRPYYDFNNNGKWDSVTTYDCSVVECTSSTQDSLNIFSFNIMDSSFMYVSDSNLTYKISSGYFNYVQFNFVITDSKSLGLHINYFEIQDFFEHAPDKNSISSDSAYVDIINLFYIDSLYKEIILEAELDYKDTTYTDLLLVRYSGYDMFYYREVSLEFYFSKDFGLLAFADNNFIIRHNRIYNKIINYFIDRANSTPILLSK